MARQLSMTAIESICSCISDGMGEQKALEACGWKSRKAFRSFLMKHEKAMDLFRAARELRAEVWAEELIDIADGPGSCDSAKHIRRDALRVETRKWIISKHLPKSYGQKMEHEHTGEVKLSLADLVRGLDDASGS